MAKKRKANSIAKQSAAADSEPTVKQLMECDIPKKKKIATNMESVPQARTKKKSKQNKKGKVRPNANWEEESVEETPFNIDQCRNALEPDDHWDLRRTFLEKNQHVLPPDELICLAQVYINVQLLGCRYPPETMKQVEKLSEGIGSDYHRSRVFMLKRTFVSATDAAASKVRRDGPMVVTNVGAGSSDQTVNDSQSNIPPFMLNCLRNDLIILNNDFRHTMQTFNALNNGLKIEANVRPKGQGMHEGFVEVSGTTIAKAVVNDGKRALRMAMENASNVLSQYCFSITRKKRANQLDGVEVIGKSEVEEREDAETDKLDTDNVGFKLLAKLGWSGGCLGVRGDGIVNPVTVDQQFGRKGLGLATATEVKLDRAMIKQKLMDLRDGKIEDHHIVFSSEYSKEDRKHIHILAMDMRLKSQSHGKDSNGTRQLVVSRKQLRPRELLRKIMLEKDPTFCEMYEVTPPTEQA